jgi:hypothetical protein
MEKAYWLGRKRSAMAMAMANGATEAEVRLTHLHLAGTYSVKAATCQIGLALPAPGSLEPLALRL